MNFRFVLSIVLISVAALFVKIFYSKNYAHLQDVNAAITLSAELSSVSSCHLIQVTHAGPKIPLQNVAGSVTSTPLSYLYPTKSTKRDMAICQLPAITVPTAHLSLSMHFSVLELIDGINLVIGNKIFVIRDVISHARLDGTRAVVDLSSFRYDPDAGFMNSYGALNMFMASIRWLLSFPASFIFTFGLLFCYVVSGRDYIRDFDVLADSAERHYKPILLCILLLGTLFRYNGMYFTSLWGDEIYSFMLAGNPYTSIDSALFDPANPPLYYVFLKAWQSVFGFGESVARGFSVFVGALGILSTFFFAKNHFNTRTGLVASLFYAISYNLISASHETRSYCLTMALVPLVANYFLNIIKFFRFKDMLAYALVGIMAANVHYYSSIFYFCNFAFACVAWGLRPISRIFTFLFVNILVALSILPHLIISALPRGLMVSDFNDWIAKPGLNDLLFTPLNMTGTELLFGVFILCLVYALFTDRGVVVRYMIYTMCVMILLPFALSQIRSIYISKYIAGIVYPFVLLFLSFASLNLRLPAVGRCIAGRSIIFLVVFGAATHTLVDSKVRYLGFGSNYSVELKYMALDSRSYESSGIGTHFFITNASIVRQDIPHVNAHISEAYDLPVSGIITDVDSLPMSGVLYIDSHFSDQEKVRRALDFYENRASILRIPISDTNFVYKIIIDELLMGGEEMAWYS